MPRRTLLLLLALAPLGLAGCVDAMVDQLEESREEAEPQGPAPATPSPTPATPTPTPPAPGGPWPQRGSFVRYELRGGEGEHASWAVRVDLTHDGTSWSGVCRGARTERHADGSSVRVAYDQAVAYAPPRGPLDPDEDDRVAIQVPSECGLRALSLLVQGDYPEDAVRAGAPVRTSAWWADEGAAREPQVDEDAWWDARTGLLLRWEAAEHETDAGVQGRLADTDAPLGG